VAFAPPAVYDVQAMLPRSALLLLAALLAVPAACLSLRAVHAEPYAYRLDERAGPQGAAYVAWFEGGVLRIDLKPQRPARSALKPPPDRRSRR
jgi:hypothetical protein